jgi:hypothetical protein
MLSALVVLGALAALSTLPPYVGPPIGLKLDVASNVELVDHVIAGGVVALSAWGAAFLLRSGRASLDSPVLMGAVGLCVLGAIWQTTTHVPLIFDAGQPQTPWGTAIFHSALGPVMTVFSLVLLWRVLGEDPADERSARA